MQDVVYEVLPIVEGLIEPKVEDSLQDFLLELASVQVSPNVGKDFMGQLEDPSGMVFTRVRASLGYDVGANLLPTMAYGSRYIMEECMEKYYEDLSISKRHAKWVVYLHINMAAVVVHKRNLILKMGYFTMDIFQCL